MAKDFYKTLGVARDASQDDIKKAFRTQAHKHHPDKGGEEAAFKEINEAYQVLGDEKKRAQYDQYGSAAFDPGGPFSAGQQGGGGFGGFGGFQQNINMEDLGDLFGDVFGFGGGRRGQQRAQGENIEADLSLTFEEAARGVDRDVELYKMVRCSHCSGGGGEPGAEKKTCETCKGAGQIAQTQRTVFGVMQTQRVCPECHGQGKSFTKRCSVCTGTGVHKERAHVRISVPAGIESGETLRVSGEGAAGLHGAPAGDLYLHIRVKPHPHFTRDGDDLVVKKDIGFTTAALGGEMAVETLDGKMTVDVPAGIQSGQVLRVRGKGLVHPRRSGKGDLLVEITVLTPKKLSKEQRRLLEELELS